MTATLAAKEYKQGTETLLAVADVACLGKTFREGKLQLQVDPGFYDGVRIDEEVFQQMFGRATVANLVGAETVGLAVALGFVDEAHVLHIDGVPHAQWTVMVG